MITQKITKWGNSLGIRLPRTVLQQFGWQEGEKISIEVKDAQLIISLARPKYTLEALLREAQPTNQHKELDWGDSQGYEAW